MFAIKYFVEVMGVYTTATGIIINQTNKTEISLFISQKDLSMSVFYGDYNYVEFLSEEEYHLLKPTEIGEGQEETPLADAQKYKGAIDNILRNASKIEKQYTSQTLDSIIVQLDAVNDDYGLSRKEDKQKKIELIKDYSEGIQQYWYELGRVSLLVDFAIAQQAQIQFVFVSD
jgi:hypothetical protein